MTPLADEMQTTASHGLPPMSARVQLVVLPWWHWFFICLDILAVWLCVYFGHRSNILRDTDDRLPKDTPNGARLPYSLARFQLAFWFLLIVSAFGGIWMITGDLDILNSSVLGLLGISTATTVSASLIDANKGTQRREKQAQIAAAQAVVDTQPASLPANPLNPNLLAGQTTAQANLSQRCQELDAIYTACQPSEGFWTDILSDSEGVNIHRFQALAWTLVLGLIFVLTVYKSLAMPDLSPTLLALMGISAGTYTLLKIPEKS
jgi:hypothetical protein